MFNIEPTKKVQAFIELKEIDILSSCTLQNFASDTKNAHTKFWFEGESPIIKMEALGMGALEMFTASAQAQAFIKMMNPDHEELGIPEGYSIEWNEDGSGEITYTEPVEEEEE